MNTFNGFYLVIPITLVLTGLIPLFYYRKHTSTTWKTLFSGAGLWVLAVAAKSLFAYFFNKPLNIFLVSIWIPLYYLYIGLLTGLFETLIPLFFIKRMSNIIKKTTDIIGLGLGFGAFESIVVGLLTLSSFLVAVFFADSLPASSIKSFTGSLPDFLLRGIYGGMERLSAIMVHTFCIFMISLFSLSYTKKSTLIIPILLKTLTDGLALYFTVAQTPKILFESIYLITGLLSTLAMWKIIKSQTYHLEEQTPPHKHPAHHHPNSRLAKSLVTRLFVALIVLSLIGWIILFGKNLPDSYTHSIYALIIIVAAAAIYVFWKKTHWLKNRFFIIALLLFIVIGIIGWVTSLPEITTCKPYRCNQEIICARPTDLGLKITTGECTSNFTQPVDFICVNKDGTCIMKQNQ